MKNRFLLYVKAEAVIRRLWIVLFRFFIFFATYLLFILRGDEGKSIAVKLSNGAEITQLIITVVVFVTLANSFSKYQNNRTGANSIMLPVSRFEKFAHAFLMSGIIIPTVLILLAYSSHLIWGNIMSINVPFFKDNFTTISGVTNIIFTFIMGLLFFASGLFFKTVPYAWACIALFIFYVIIQKVETSFPDIVYLLFALFIYFGILYGSWIRFKNLQIK